MKLYYFTIIALTILFFGCKGKTTQEEEVSTAKQNFNPDRNLVDTMRLVKSDFNREIISNGTLRATKRAQLKFRNGGEVAQIYAKNGDRVAPNAPIIKLNEEDLKNRLDQAQLAMQKAELDFKDNLIGFGYGTDTTKVPKEVLRLSKIKSGYINAIHNLNSAQRDLKNATLRAPFGGVVANLSVKQYEAVSGEVICMVIDNSSFDVEFNLLESELSYIRVGQTVKVSAYVNLQDSFEGVIKEINPLVDEKGQVKVVASLKNKGGALVDGMNVKILIESLLKNQLSVPKSAVVIRDGFDVLFTLDTQTNRVTWVYVDVIASNSSCHVVRGNEFKNVTLNEGEIVVTSGNLNLADNSLVEIKSY
jgi:RND family efflux transporter, MFP subunit